MRVGPVRHEDRNRSAIPRRLTGYMQEVRLEPNVVPGIHRIEDSFTNWYLIEDAGRLTVVDTGVPSSWESLHAVLSRLG
jgi:hypothetical protein